MTASASGIPEDGVHRRSLHSEAKPGTTIPPMHFMVSKSLDTVSCVNQVYDRGAREIRRKAASRCERCGDRLSLERWLSRPDA